MPASFQPHKAVFSTEEAILDAVEQVRDAAVTTLREGEDYVRKEPVSAVLYAIAAGYVLRFLPVAGIIRLLVGIILSVIRPLALLYGIAKIYEHLQRSQYARTSSAELQISGQ